MQRSEPERQPSGPPPPYPDDPTPPERAVRMAAAVPRVGKKLLEDPDLEICTHWHTLLVSILEPEDQAQAAAPRDSKHLAGGGRRDKKQQRDSLPRRTVLHFWSPADVASKSSTFVATSLTEDNLRYVQGFRELGDFTFPLAGDSGPSEVHAYLTSLSNETNPSNAGDDADNDDDSEDVVETIGAQLALLSTSDAGPRVRMFTISVLSDSPDALFASGDAPAWKWAKPSNVYGRKTGHWALEPADAVESAAWMAGRDIMLLVRGFHEEHRAWLAANPASTLPAKGKRPDEAEAVARATATEVSEEIIQRGKTRDYN